MRIFEYAQLLLWLTTYILVVAECLKSKEPPILPLTAVILNLSQELLIAAGWIDKARYNAVFMVIIVCVAAGLAILGLWWRYLARRKYGVCVIVLTIAALFVAVIVQRPYFYRPYLKTLMIFGVDLIMAAVFVIAMATNRIRLNRLSAAIGITKLLGDLCAMIYYSKYGLQITIIGLVVLLLNSSYVVTLGARMQKQVKS